MLISGDISMFRVHVIFCQNSAIFTVKTAGSDFTGYICYEIMFLIKIKGILLIFCFA